VPSRNTGIIEWEGTAERVAIHWPYIVLFNSHFIEVRHVEAGLLTQIIPGNGIRCIWDDRSTFAPASTGSEGLLRAMNIDPRIHCVMAETDAAGRPESLDHVFELAPNMPFYSHPPSDF